MQAGYEIIFIAPESRRYKGHTVIQWLIDTAKSMGITGMTRRSDAAGAGRDGRLHSAHFFELADSPVELMFVVDEQTGDRLLERVKAEGIHIFCLRKPVEYGDLGAP